MSGAWSPPSHTHLAAQVADGDLLKPWQLQREKYKQRKRQLGAREKGTMSRLEAFTQKLKAADAQVRAQLLGARPPKACLRSRRRVASKPHHTSTWLTDASRFKVGMMPTEGTLVQLSVHALRHNLRRACRV